MFWTCTLLLAGALPGRTPGAQAVPNLDFKAGQLTHWEGQGFYVTAGSGHGPGLVSGVCSSDRGTEGKTALLHRTFVVPPGAGAIRVTAAAIRPAGCPPGPLLDVVLEASGRRYLPRLIRGGADYRPAPQLGSLVKGRAQEYYWPVSAHIGQPLRVALIDKDDRPGCFLFCGGFEVVSQEEFEGRLFAEQMLHLTREQKLPSMTRFDSKHFMAIGNTVEEYTEHRLYNCETIYALFFDHFRRKGFAVREPKVKLMVAIFDSQSGFESYIGQAMPTSVTGFYHRVSNRLVVYDYARNRAYLEGKAEGDKALKQLPFTLERQRVISDFSRQVKAMRNDANIGTIMHEVAHQLSFNGGMLNREGDSPLWLVEGLANYCEATRNGEWLGIGEANASRLGTLAAALKNKGAFLPLHDMLGSDDWLHNNATVGQALLGYAQSWALFRMLMEQSRDSLRKYLALIYPRRTPEQRLADFAQVFGGDLQRFELRYHQYIREIVREEYRPVR